jgi:hypothetical protein
MRESALCKHNHIQAVGEAKAMEVSVKGLALCKHDHIQTVGRPKQWRDQQRGQHYASIITYILWERPKVVEGSVRGLALCKHHHIHPVKEAKRGGGISKGVNTMQAP